MALDKQMEMFNDGGLMDEGGTVDPVSGNDVPPGSTQEEVRDDIPAQLSEGEFVFPADVVRFIGLNNLMQMRQQAKMGLKMMEEMGQMGNSEEATIPDDLPFDINDLDMEDEIDNNNELEMQVGGFVQPTQQQQQMGISGFQQAVAPTTGVAAVPQQAASQQYVQPMQAAVPTTPVYTAADIPTFKGFVGENVPGVDFEYVEYKNEAGNVIQLRKSKTTGDLLDPIPEGYTFVDPEKTATEEVTTTPTMPQTVTVTETGGDDEARQRREEEMYGPGGGRLGVKGKTYGISFDGVGLLEGRGMLTGLALSGEIPDKYATSVSVNIKRGNDEFTVRGDDYNELKQVIKDSGANSPAAENKLAELRRQSNAIKEAKRKAQEEFDRLAKLKENEEERKRTKVQPSSDDPGGKGPFGTGYTYDPKSVKETTDYVESGYQEASGGGGGGSPSSSSGSSSSSSSGSSKSSSSGSSGSSGTQSGATGGGYGGGFGDRDRFRAKGGLMEAPKPKTKKMKRGGLASKK